jgi:hypothetical protein
MALLAPDMLLWYSRGRLYSYHMHIRDLVDLMDMGVIEHGKPVRDFESAGQNIFFLNVMPYLESLLDTQ